MNKAFYIHEKFSSTLGAASASASVEEERILSASLFSWSLSLLIVQNCCCWQLQHSLTQWQETEDDLYLPFSLNNKIEIKDSGAIIKLIRTEKKKVPGL